jgi:Zn-dependent protease
MGMGGFRIATIRGIPIRIHVSFLFVLPLLAFGFARAFQAAAELAGVPPSFVTGRPWLWGLGVALALFVSVLVHELAHALYAVATGGRVRGITLLMIGGVSEIAEAPKGPRREGIMAFVGPVVSLALGALFFLLHLAAARASFSLRFALFHVAMLNTFLGLFNLLPAFPMDGGRILRALLTPRLGIVRATGVAARVGQVFAVLFGIWGFLSWNMFLVLIAFFVFSGAQAETRAVVVKALLGDLHVRDVMRSQPPMATIAPEASALSPSDDLAKALRLMSEQDLTEVPVTEGARLVGTVSRADLVHILEDEARQRPHGPPAHA